MKFINPATMSVEGSGGTGGATTGTIDTLNGWKLGLPIITANNLQVFYFGQSEPSNEVITAYNALPEEDYFALQQFFMAAGGFDLPRKLTKNYRTPGSSSYVTFAIYKTGFIGRLAIASASNSGSSISSQSNQTYFYVPNYLSRMTYQDYSITHNATYRGDDLLSVDYFGNIDNLYETVKAGDFNDIFVGDYITYENQKYIVMGVDFYKNKGIVENEAHHLVIVPENAMGTAKMNSTNTISTGYANSELHKTVLPNTYLPIMNLAFNSHILNGSWTLTIDGQENTEKQTCKIRLLNEVAVFGDVEQGKNSDIGEMDAILPGFKLNAKLQIKYVSYRDYDWWLSSIYKTGSSSFVYATRTETGTDTGVYYSNRSWHNVNTTDGVVPMILFG